MRPFSSLFRRGFSFSPPPRIRLFSSNAIAEETENEDGHATKHSLLYSCPTTASQRVMLMSGCASAHAAYWASFSAYQIAIGEFFSQTPSMLDLDSPVWTYAGVSLSCVFLGLSKVFADATIGQCSFAAGKLAIRTHTFWGSLGTPGDVNLRGFKVQPEMISLEYEAGSFHRIIDRKLCQLLRHG